MRLRAQINRPYFGYENQSLSTLPTEQQEEVLPKPAVLFLEQVQYPHPGGSQSRPTPDSMHLQDAPGPSAQLRRTASSANRKKYAAIVLYDAAGWGLTLAELIPQAMRKVTMIVFREQTPAAIEPYLALGYSTFSATHEGEGGYNLAKFLEQVSEM